MAEEICWLIERADSNPGFPNYLYVRGGFNEHAPQEAAGTFGWTENPNDALRFSRKLDAAMVAAGIRELNDQIPHRQTLRGMVKADGEMQARICEHVFMDSQALHRSR